MGVQRSDLVARNSPIGYVRNRLILSLIRQASHSHRPPPHLRSPRLICYRLRMCRRQMPERAGRFFASAFVEIRITYPSLVGRHAVRINLLHTGCRLRPRLAGGRSGGARPAGRPKRLLSLGWQDAAARVAEGLQCLLMQFSAFDHHQLRLERGLNIQQQRYVRSAHCTGTAKVNVAAMYSCAKSEELSRIAKDVQLVDIDRARKCHHVSHLLQSRARPCDTFGAIINGSYALRTRC